MAKVKVIIVDNCTECPLMKLEVCDNTKEFRSFCYARLPVPVDEFVQRNTHAPFCPLLIGKLEIDHG